MTREQFEGQIREFLNVAGGAVAAFGYANDSQVQAVAGLALSVIMLFVGFKNKDGFGKMVSLIRKVAGAVGAAVVAFNWLDPSKAVALVGVLGPLFAILSSWKSNGGKLPIGRLPLVLLAFFLTLGLPSCTVSVDAQGEPIFSLNPLEAYRVIEEKINPGEALIEEPSK